MKSQIIEKINEFVLTAIENNYADNRGVVFSEPLVGFANINDLLFREYKKYIGKEYFTPQEAFELKYPGQKLIVGTVISWVLPISQKIRDTNAQQKDIPSEDWAYSKFSGEPFNDKVRQMLVNFLTEKNFQTLAPILLPEWKIIQQSKVGMTSLWSERHAAYAAGLGTFSLNDGLITERGIAHRCGSVITNLVIEPTKREYRGVYDYCLHYKNGSCHACIDRCPVQAISVRGHDKNLCSDFTKKVVLPFVSEKYGTTDTCCGLCQTRVPCEKGIPDR